MKIGYARVSTQDQNHNLQIDALKEYGCDKIYSDKVSGKSTKREGLDAALEALSEGDELVVWKSDRLGRSMIHTCTIVEAITKRGIFFKSLTEGYDSQTASGRFHMHVMLASAELERGNISERVTAGLAAAKARGVLPGPKGLDSGTKQAIVEMRMTGATCREVANEYGVSAKTVCKYTKGML